jgi:hypothetical protein
MLVFYGCRGIRKEGRKKGRKEERKRWTEERSKGGQKKFK